MNWNDKAREIAERICTCDELEKADFADNIIYDENGRLDLNHIVSAIRPLVEKAAMEGMKFECDEWCHGKRQMMEKCAEMLKQIIDK